LCVTVAALAFWWFALREGGGCGTKGAIACPPPELEEGVGVTLNAAKVCPAAGSLCAGRTEFQVARWPLDKGKLRVHVGLPDFLEAETARQIRDAAVEGIKEWDGHPFPLIVGYGLQSDIDVVWSQGVYNDTSGGGLSSRGRADGKRFKFEVDSLSVVVPQIRTAEPSEITPTSDPDAMLAQAAALPNGAMVQSVTADTP